MPLTSGPWVSFCKSHVIMTCHHDRHLIMCRYIMIAGVMPFAENSFEDIKTGNYSMDDEVFNEVSDHAKDMLKR